MSEQTVEHPGLRLSIAFDPPYRRAGLLFQERVLEVEAGSLTAEQLERLDRDPAIKVEQVEPEADAGPQDQAPPPPPAEQDKADAGPQDQAPPPPPAEQDKADAGPQDQAPPPAQTPSVASGDTSPVGRGRKQPKGDDDATQG